MDLQCTFLSPLGSHLTHYYNQQRTQHPLDSHSGVIGVTPGRTALWPQKPELSALTYVYYEEKLTFQ